MSLERTCSVSFLRLFIYPLTYFDRKFLNFGRRFEFQLLAEVAAPPEEEEEDEDEDEDEEVEVEVEVKTRPRLIDAAKGRRKRPSASHREMK